jgi:hypothetical protein
MTATVLLFLAFVVACVLVNDWLASYVAWRRMERVVSAIEYRGKLMHSRIKELEQERDALRERIAHHCATHIA